MVLNVDLRLASEVGDRAQDFRFPVEQVGLLLAQMVEFFFELLVSEADLLSFAGGTQRRNLESKWPFAEFVEVRLLALPAAFGGYPLDDIDPGGDKGAPVGVLRYRKLLNLPSLSLMKAPLSS